MINMRVETCEGKEQVRRTKIVHALDRWNDDGEGVIKSVAVYGDSPKKSCW
jgi:hypothetical protein